MKGDTAPSSAQPLTAAAFAPFGDVIEAAGDELSDQRRDVRPLPRPGADRGHRRRGAAGISVGGGGPTRCRTSFDLVERHPFGSQAFVPMTADPFLVVVAPDEGGRPGGPRAFLTAPGQGVNYLRGTWHGVLTPLGRAGALPDRRPGRRRA